MACQIKTLEQLIARHPRPWRRGEQHETMCWIVDANGKNICQITPGADLFEFYIIEMVADKAIEAVNQYEEKRIIS